MLTCVALDGFRLAIAKKPVLQSSCECSIIVPARSLSEISKLLASEDETIKVLIQRNYLMVQLDGTRVISRCLGTKDDFINYKQIIPSSFSTNVTISKKQLLDALERASILARVGGDNSVKFTFNGNLLTVNARSEVGAVTEKITISLNGEDLTIAFNTNFFMDCLRNIEDDYVILKFNGQVNPCFIVPNTDQEEYTYLISPIRQVY